MIAMAGMRLPRFSAEDVPDRSIGGGSGSRVIRCRPPDQSPAKRLRPMSDVTTSKPKSKSGDAPKFEIPHFEIPKFEMPKMEVPAAFREFAEKSVSQCKDSWEKMKAVTEEATDVIEDSYATATKGCADYGLKV